MKFSYSAIWDDAVRLLKLHGSLIVAVAGVFLLLPELLTSYFLPMPRAKTIGQLIQLTAGYFTLNWPWLLAAGLVSAAGSITILLLLFSRGQTTVGGAIRGAMPLLIGYALASFVANAMIVAGSMLLAVPGLYLLGRLAPIGAVVVAEQRRNPVEALHRTVALTRGKGWAVCGFVVLVYLAGSLVVFATSRVIGALFLVAAGPQLGDLLSLILDAALAAALTTVTLVVYAAVYRRLTASA